MKKNVVLIVFFLLIQIFPQEAKMTDVKKIIDEVKLKYAPDKRTAIFNINVEETDGKVVLSGETTVKAAEVELIEKVRNAGKILNKIVVLPSKELGDKTYGVFTISTANVRNGREHSDEMATQGILGMPVRVYDKKGGWYLVQTVDDYIGWVDDDAVELMTKSEANEWLTCDKVIVKDFYGTVLDKEGIPVSDVVKGNLLKLKGKDGSNVIVEFPDKRTGYIEESKVENFKEWLNKVTPVKENIVKTGFLFSGIPYLWGGTSTKGVDCSGFTKSVYYFNGIILPRDASQQVFAGEEVDIKNGFGKLEPGDLLFFGSKKEDGKEKVTHVAIYIGDNDFIHSSGMVRVNSLDKNKKNFSQYRFNTLLRAKRIIGAKNENNLIRKCELLNKPIE